jgi:hypothetical protein
MGGPRVPDDRRRLLLRAALGFLQLPATEPELLMLHRWLDTWDGIGLIVAGMQRQSWDLQLTGYGDGHWRATFLRGRDRALHRGRLGVRADAVAGGAAGGVGDTEPSGGSAVSSGFGMTRTYRGRARR